jgi:hypothetical protein
LCRPWLGHPSRQQRSRAVGLLDDEVAAATMLQTADDSHAFACTRVMRVLYQDVEALFLGGMSRSRRER